MFGGFISWLILELPGFGEEHEVGYKLFLVAGHDKQTSLSNTPISKVPHPFFVDFGIPHIARKTRRNGCASNL